MSISRYCCYALLHAITMILMSADSIGAKEHRPVEQQIRAKLQAEEYDKLGKLLKHNVDRKINLGNVQKIAKEYGSQPLVHAIDATRKIHKATGKQRLDLSRRRVMQTALFI